MSRGIKVFYAATIAGLPTSTGFNQPDDPQLGDYCLIKSDLNSPTPRPIDYGTVESFLASDNFQARVYVWNALEAWEETTNYTFTDEDIIANVTKIRKAHMQDIRNVIKVIQDYKLNKYGDFYYNTHDYTNAVMYWGRDTDLARIYFGDNGSDNQFLTVEFGNNRSSEAGDRVRFMYRDGNLIFDPILDILGEQVHVYKNMLVSGTTHLVGDTLIDGNLHLVGSATFDTNLYVDKLTTLNGATLINGPTTIQNTLYVRDNATVHTNLLVEGHQQTNGHIEADQYIATDTQLISRVASGTPPLEVASVTVVTNLNADLLDGAHRGDTVDLVPTNNGILQGDGNEIDPRYGTAKHRVGSGLNAHMLDGYHIQDVIDQIASVTYNGTSYIDAGGHQDGLALQVKIDGTNYFVPSSSRANGVCHSSCHASCHGSCHCFRMCHMYIDEAFQKERK
jgi:hypothetical protein